MTKKGEVILETIAKTEKFIGNEFLYMRDLELTGE